MTAAIQESDFHTKDHRGLPMPKDGTYLRPKAIQDLNSEIEHIDGMLSDKGVVPADARAMKKRAANIREKIAIQGAPELSPEQRDIAHRREQELRADIQASMCSPEEMRKCPSGAIGKFQRGEDSPAQKEKTLEWKNLMLMMNPGNNDPDLCNIEQFRKNVVSTLTMTDAQIQGQAFFIPPNTEQYKAGYDGTFGTPEERERIKQLEDEMAELKALLLASSKPAPAKAASKRAVPKKVAMPCGVMKDARGRITHIKHCDDERCKSEE